MKNIMKTHLQHYLITTKAQQGSGNFFVSSCHFDQREKS